MKIGANQPYNYTICNQNINHVLQHIEQEKDIGVIFDSNPEFDAHINEKKKQKKSKCRF